jgi:hypothetical protein
MAKAIATASIAGAETIRKRDHPVVSGSVIGGSAHFLGGIKILLVKLYCLLTMAFPRAVAQAARKTRGAGRKTEDHTAPHPGGARSRLGRAGAGAAQTVVVAQAAAHNESKALSGKGALTWRGTARDESRQ